MLPYGMFISQNWGLATPRNISHLNGTVLRGCAAQLVGQKGRALSLSKQRRNPEIKPSPTTTRPIPTNRQKKPQTAKTQNPGTQTGGD